jgi:hypothetical protein
VENESQGSEIERESTGGRREMEGVVFEFLLNVISFI